MENKKIDVITVQGMEKTFGVSRSTVYKKYIPNLTKVATTSTRVYFDYAEAKKLHKRLTQATEHLNVIA